MNKEFEPILKNIEEALTKAISLDFAKDWQDNSFGPLPNAITPDFIQKLIEPNKNLIDLGGKRWRPLLLILCYRMFSKNSASSTTEAQAYELTPLVEFVHTASLIHDDIEDNADLRRGKPAAHITYGLDTALNAASWLYFEAPVCINKSSLPLETKQILYKLYTNELRKLHLGQAMDIYWHRNPEIFPEIEQYNGMVRCKTGTLASLAAQIGCIAAGATESEAFTVGDTAANIGMGFQIIDDVINLTTGNAGKKRGDDIVEGKKSLPVLIHISEHPEDKTVIAQYFTQAAKEGIDSPAVENCIALLQKSGSIEKAAKKGTKLIAENCSLLQSDLIKDLFTSMIPENFR